MVAEWEHDIQPQSKSIFYSGKSFFWVKKQKKQQADIEKYDYFSFHKNRSLLFLQYMIIIKDK